MSMLRDEHGQAMGVQVTEHDDGTVTMVHKGASVTVKHDAAAIADACWAFGQAEEMVKSTPFTFAECHAQIVAQTSKAAEIAAGVDVDTVAGHNLRALLLRLADGDDAGPWQTKDRANLLGLGISEGPGLGTFRLTQLGREVADLLRPKPWSVTTNRGFPRLIKPNGDFAAEMAGELDLCRRIADLLTRDDLDAAKRYRTETP